ncbi:MAG: 2-amino-4-hydroxy-6-hydroxymethyldihydropteridine diphosphokinase [Myxococcota bacterium]
MRVLLGLGTSHPRGRAVLQQAAAALARLERIQLVALSPAVKSPAWGNGTLFPFTNAAAAVTAGCPLQVVWQSLQALEQRFGRLRVWPNGPRTLDIDVLWCDASPSVIPELTVPHPRLSRRPWALLPAMEAARQAGWVLPWGWHYKI